MSDAINPGYYQFSGVEVIQLTEQLPFIEGSIVKYVCRHSAKNGLEDLKKARWYLDRLIANEESKMVPTSARVNMLNMPGGPVPYLDHN